METRIYDGIIEIDTDDTRAFYDKRAANMSSFEYLYTTVMLRDQDPHLSEKYNIFEKENILPMLKIGENERVLDIGCGIGRWAESIIPLAGYYCGSDLSEEMIKVAKDRCRFPEKNYSFINCSFQEIVRLPSDYFDKPFNRLVISGCCIYINDNELKECYKNIIKFLDKECLIYLKESVSLKRRITLKNHPSEALKSNYSAIYRTLPQYNELYSVFTENGFKVTKQEFMPQFNTDARYSETEGAYTILER